MQFWLDIIGLVANTLAAAFLWRGSMGIPWDMQTWKGKSPDEEAHKQRTTQARTMGFILLAGGFLLQLISRFVG